MAGKRDDLEVVVGADLGGLAADLRAGVDAVKGFARDVDRAMPRVKDIAPSVDTKGLREVSRAAKDGGMSVRALAADMAMFAGKMAVTGGTLVALEMGLDGLGSTFRHVKESVAMAAELEQTTLAFDVMLGSAERAKEMVGSLRKLAAETPFNSKDITGAGKQLLAYGIAADQIIPTMRMLGDVSAGFGKDLPLKDLSYLYGTLFAQQRAYAVDIRQFAGRGIPIYEELAKIVGKSSDEVKDLVENGRVGRDEVTKAFIAMTSEGGKFFKMTERQSQTLLGIWEQVTDAFDLAKIKLGQIIIEEAGLKGIARDLEGFGKRLELGIDTHGLREGVRLSADIVKGVTQVSYEFARAGVISANIFGEMASQFPAFRDTFETIGSIIKDMKDFRLDPDSVAHLAISGSKEILAQTGAMASLIATMGEAFTTNILEPIVQTLREIRGTAEDVQNYKVVGKAVWDIVKPSNQLKIFGEQLGMASGGAIGEAASANARVSDDPMRKTISEMVASAKRFSDAMGRNAEALDRMEVVMRDRLTEQKRTKEIDELRAVLAERRKELAAQLVFEKAKYEGAIAFPLGMSAFDPMSGIVASSIAYRREMQKVNAYSALGGGAMGLAVNRDIPSTAGVRMMGDPGAGVREVVKGLRDKYDPLAEGGKLKQHKNDLDEALSRGMITPQMHERGWNDAVREVADRLGVGAHARLPDAVLEGSQEDARLLARFMSGQQPRSTEDLLQQLIELNKRLVSNTSPANQAPMPRAVGIVVPGGG